MVHFHYKSRLKHSFLSLRLLFCKLQPLCLVSLSLSCTVMELLIKRPSILPFLGFMLVQSCIFQLVQSSTNFTEQSALIAFKSKLTSGPNQTVLAGNWSTTTNFCDWIRVSCSRRRQRVTTLNLRFMGL